MRCGSHPQHVAGRCRAPPAPTHRARPSRGWSATCRASEQDPLAAVGQAKGGSAGKSRLTDASLARDHRRPGVQRSCLGNGVGSRGNCARPAPAASGKTIAGYDTGPEVAHGARSGDAHDLRRSAATRERIARRTADRQPVLCQSGTANLARRLQAFRRREVSRERAAEGRKPDVEGAAGGAGR